MKIRKNTVAWIGIILCVLVAGIILGTKANNLFALLPAALFIPLVITLAKADVKKEEEKTEEDTPKKERNWPLTICWALVIFTAIIVLLVLFTCGWWFLLPLTVLFGLLMWLATLLEWHAFWSGLFVILAAIAITLLGVYGIVGSSGGIGGDGHLENLYVDNLYAENANVADMDVENETVANQDVENQKVENQDTENSAVNNQTVTNQVVENQTVENQTVENQTVPPTTEPPVTEPPVTEPPVTEPPVTEPPATEPEHTHSYISEVTEPTCMEQGYTTHTCSCGDSYKDSYKGALGHSYKSTVVEPTTSAGGYTEHKCERCGHTYKDTFTDKLGNAKLTQKSSLKYGAPAKVSFEGIGYDALRIHNSSLAQMNRLDNNTFEVELLADVTGEVVISNASGAELLTLAIVIE